jgi:hypothetical protein
MDDRSKSRLSEEIFSFRASGDGRVFLQWRGRTVKIMKEGDGELPPRERTPSGRAFSRRKALETPFDDRSSLLTHAPPLGDTAGRRSTVLPGKEANPCAQPL